MGLVRYALCEWCWSSWHPENVELVIAKNYIAIRWQMPHSVQQNGVFLHHQHIAAPAIATANLAAG